MTRDDAIALLELMKREQRRESGVPPVEPHAVARRYVKIVSQLDETGRYGAGQAAHSGAYRRCC